MKFRVWDNQEKKYVNGSYIDENGKLFVISWSFEEKEYLDPDRYTVEMSTGAYEFWGRNEKGKEFYQGDVVQCDCFDTHDIDIVEITDFKKLPYEMTGSKCNSRKWIGTIHDGVKCCKSHEIKPETLKIYLFGEWRLVSELEKPCEWKRKMDRTGFISHETECGHTIDDIGYELEADIKHCCFCSRPIKEV